MSKDNQLHHGPILLDEEPDETEEYFDETQAYFDEYEDNLEGPDYNPDDEPEEECDPEW